MNRLAILYAVAVVLVTATTTVAYGPVPIGEADVTFSYPTATGMRVLTSSVDYSGTGMDDIIPLGGDPNIGYFNSANSFGRRMLVDGAVGENETLLAHSFFKTDNSTEFFADIIEGAWLTIEVQNIQFAEPMRVLEDTVMMHKLWDADQVDKLRPFYFSVHNQDTGTDPFRDFDSFFHLVFSEFPSPNYELGVLSGASAIEVFGEGTNTLGFRMSVPYERLRHYEDVGQEVPPGLPAPFGFLEPFHFHLAEFVVAPIPEPATALMLLVGLPLVLRRRRR